VNTLLNRDELFISDSVHTNNGELKIYANIVFSIKHVSKHMLVLVHGLTHVTLVISVIYAP